MTIIGRGDLSPPRRHRPVGRYVTVALVVILLGGGGFAGYKGLKGTSAASPAAKLAPCKKGSPAGTPKPRQSGKTRIVVDNATLTAGLASQAATELRGRGFTIASVGNTPMRGHGVAMVRYSPDRKLVAEQLAAQIKGATIVVVGGSKHVEVDLGPKYRTLQSRTAAKASLRTMLAADQRSASPSPSVTPTARCRPRPVGSTRG